MGEKEAVKGEFRVEGTKIIGPEGGEFIVKGTNVNGRRCWWDRETTQDAALISDVWKFNAVRVNCVMQPEVFFNGWEGPKKNDDTDKIVKAFTDRGVVVMLELHDWTMRYPTQDEMKLLTDWWVDWANKYKDNPYVWFNIMNEPGAPSEEWKTAHDAVIQAIRDTGANNIIVLDGNQGGQEGGFKDPSTSAILKYGEYFANKYENMVFSLHMYDGWTGGQERLASYVQQVHDKSLALIVGEYGGGSDGPRSASAAMFNVCVPNHVGRMVWHWDGGDIHQLVEGIDIKGGYQIDRTDGSKPGNLSWLGNQVWEDNHGNLSVKGPDLSVQDVAVSKTDFAPGDTLHFAATVRNMGTISLPADSKFAVKFMVNGEEVSSQELTGSLGINGARTVVSEGYQASDKNVTVKALIQYDADINEANNAAEVKFGPQEGCDLVVKDIAVDKEKAAYGDHFQIKVTLFNQGTQASPNQWTGVILKVNENFMGKTGKTISLAPGESITLGPIDSEAVKVREDFVLQAIPVFDKAQAGEGNGVFFKEMAYDAENENLLLNAGFEEGTAPWQAWGNLSVSMNTDGVHSGKQALQVEKTGGGGQYLSVEPNTTYRLAGWGRVDTPGEGCSFGLQYDKDVSGTKGQHIIDFRNTEYEYKGITFTTASHIEAGSANVFVWKGGGSGSFYLDDIVLQQVKEN